MRVTLDARLRAAIAIADGVRNPHDLPADELAERHRKTEALALAAGFTPERATEVADEALRTITAFAEALRTAADAAESVLTKTELLSKELTNNGRTH